MIQSDVTGVSRDAYPVSATPLNGGGLAPKLDYHPGAIALVHLILRLDGSSFSRVLRLSNLRVHL
jgi:hypothetical protein